VSFSLVHNHRFKRTGNRNKIFLATKFGIIKNGVNGKPEYVRASAEKSLKRLGVEAIDLYYLHVGISYSRCISYSLNSLVYQRADHTVPIEVR